MTSWLNTFFIDSSGLLTLAQALLAGALAGLLLRVRRPTRATRLLAGSALALTGVWLSNFLIIATLMPLWLKTQTLFLLLGPLCFIQFAYHYPITLPEQRREARYALIFSAAVMAALMGWRLVYPDRATALFRAVICGALILTLGWTFGVWLRRLRYFTTDKADAASARAIRAFLGVTLALLALIVLSLLVVYVVTPLGYLPQPALIWLFYLSAAAFLLLLTIVYLNHAAEKNSLMDKLLFSTLVIVVTLVGLTGQGVLVGIETEYQEIYTAALQETEAVLRAGQPLTAATLPEEVSLVLTRAVEPDAPDFPRYAPRFAREPQRVDAAYLDTGRLWCERSICRAGPGPEQRHYIATDTCLEHAGQCYVLGLDYSQYRARLHRYAIPIMQMLLVAVLLVWLLLPYFFSTALITPLANLLQGAREVNAGNFAIQVPVQYNDEIGRVTETFNFMLATIHQEQEQLEAQVVARTAELSQANAQLQAEIVERAQAEQALRESEERFATVMNCMQAIMYVADMETYEILFVNEYTRRLFGDVVGQTCWQVLQAGQSGPCDFCTNPHLVRDGQPTGLYLWEFQNTVTGHWYQVQDQAVRWVDGRLVRVEIATDITRLKNTEAALRENMQRYRMVAENANDVIWTLNNEFQFTYISPSIQRLRGLTPEEAMQESVEATMTPESYQLVAQRIMETLEAEAQGRFDVVSQMEVEQYHRDGSTVWVEIVSQPMLDEHGQKAGYIGISRNITERKQMEDALRQAKEAAEEAQYAAEAANRAKSIFLANMSHELRTPLNAVLGFSQLLVRATNFTDVQRRNLEIINRSGEHLLMLINDILEISKIESGRVEFRSQTFNLVEMLRGLVEMFQLRATQRGLTLTLDYAPDTLPHYITTDLGKLRQVLINLLGNAVKFTSAGHVTLRVRRDSASETQANIIGLHFAVEDTGVGIAAEELELLFQPFVQTASGKQTQQGSGLGLTISHKYVTMLGGTLQVESEPDVGSCFSFSVPVEVIPARARQAEAVSPESAADAPAPSTFRILIVEDNVDSAALLTQILTSLGFKVQTAAHGEEAVTRWEAWRPHLIFMDMRMPVMDGREATRRIRASEGGDAAIIVALTAHAFEEDRRDFLAIGCDDFIRKPVREKALNKVLHRHLGVGIPVAPPASAEAAPPRIEALPDTWIAQFRQAAISADISGLYALLDEIAETYPHQTRVFRELTDNFAYAEILARLSPP